MILLAVGGVISRLFGCPFLKPNPILRGFEKGHPHATLGPNLLQNPGAEQDDAHAWQPGGWQVLPDMETIGLPSVARCFLASEGSAWRSFPR